MTGTLYTTDTPGLHGDRCGVLCLPAAGGQLLCSLGFPSVSASEGELVHRRQSSSDQLFPVPGRLHHRLHHPDWSHIHSESLHVGRRPDSSLTLWGHSYQRGPHNSNLFISWFRLGFWSKARIRVMLQERVSVKCPHSIILLFYMYLCVSGADRMCSQWSVSWSESCWPSAAGVTAALLQAVACSAAATHSHLFSQVGKHTYRWGGKKSFDSVKENHYRASVILLFIVVVLPEVSWVLIGSSRWTGRPLWTWTSCRTSDQSSRSHQLRLTSIWVSWSPPPPHSWYHYNTPVHSVQTTPLSPGLVDTNPSPFLYLSGGPCGCGRNCPPPSDQQQDGCSERWRRLDGRTLQWRQTLVLTVQPGLIHTLKLV